MQVQPLYDQVLIEPLQGEEKTASGIVLPDSAKEKPQKGVVKKLGMGEKDREGNEIKFLFKEGDTVMYKKWGGSEVKVDGKEMLIVKLEDVLAIVS